MNNKDLLNSYLLLLKSTVEVYVHGTLESSNKETRNLLKKSLDNTMSMQGNIYDEMVKYNWYTVENVNSNITNDAIIKIYNN